MVKLKVTIVAKFNERGAVSVYNSDLGLSEVESSCDKGEEVYAYWEPSVVGPEEAAAWAELPLLSL